MGLDMWLYQVKPLKNIKYDGMRYTDVIDKNPNYTLFDIEFYSEDNNLQVIEELKPYGKIVNLKHENEEDIKVKYRRYLLVDLEEIAYWRKNYKLQDMFHVDIGNTLNCVYHKISQKMTNYLIDEDEISSWQIDEDGVLFYQEWY